jgi:hypothetical protein
MLVGDVFPVLRAMPVDCLLSHRIFRTGCSPIPQENGELLLTVEYISMNVISQVRVAGDISISCQGIQRLVTITMRGIVNGGALSKCNEKHFTDHFPGLRIGQLLQDAPRLQRPSLPGPSDCGGF